MTGTMPSVARDIDALVAENRALRDELEALQQTHVAAMGTCCCDAKAVVQPCGPCRLADHEDCVGPKGPLK